ncbi:hypothetical protein D3C86_1999920 [compost metagenome]
MLLCADVKVSFPIEHVDASTHIEAALSSIVIMELLTPPFEMALIYPAAILSAM